VAAPSSGALTAAGYTQSPTGVWTNTFGTISVVFDLRGEPSGGVLTVTPSGDDLAADVINASNSLSALGFPGLAVAVPVAGDNAEDLGSVGGLQSFSMSL
jgi:hypothetical protein